MLQLDTEPPRSRSKQRRGRERTHRSSSITVLIYFLLSLITIKITAWNINRSIVFVIKLNLQPTLAGLSWTILSLAAPVPVCYLVADFRHFICCSSSVAGTVIHLLRMLGAIVSRSLNCTQQLLMHFSIFRRFSCLNLAQFDQKSYRLSYRCRNYFTAHYKYSANLF